MFALCIDIELQKNEKVFPVKEDLKCQKVGEKNLKCEENVHTCLVSLKYVLSVTNINEHQSKSVGTVGCKQKLKL